MYKISEVAEMLSVEKVKIFEALIVHDEVLSPFVSKERHLSFISDEGVRKIERIIFNIPEPVEVEIVPIEAVQEEKDPIKEKESEIEVEMEEEAFDRKIRDCILKRESLKNEIVDLKRQVNTLDKDLRLKDEAVINYQKILSEDLIWLIKLEAKVDAFRTDFLSTLEIDQKKSSFFKFKK